MSNKGLYEKIFKRIFDVLISTIALILSIPLLLIVAILVRVKLGSPVIFKQKRPGLNEKIFTLFKFRTMTDERDENGNLLTDSDRLTKFGKFLRSTSIDELPSLLNILRGDMSLVGPRPQLTKDMMFMSPSQRQRHSVRPGLTGYSQVNGRNNISWEEKLSLDLQYIKKITFLNDIKLILSTVFKVLKREDISKFGMDTAEDLGDYLLNENKITIGQYEKTMKEYKKLFESNINKQSDENYE
jgi:undecaprenyl phosphate N,N'-diacetylbacillosamine 1-phosphate transferase